MSVTPAIDHSGALPDNAAAAAVGSSGRSRTGAVGSKRKSGRDKTKNRKGGESGLSGSEVGESGRESSHGGGAGGCDSVSFRLGNLQKYVEGEQVAAGWPAWLSAVAGEAIQGWVPLRADSFEKLEKIGQGTYSSVFRARDLDSGKIVALKKVRFDNFEPESIRFMAREIKILRKLDHPNIIKLEGLIASRLSSSIYLVFEYMEHDLTGLLACPDVNFTESQIKCYMKQLLSGLEHCHSRGVMHRDIKGSNILINNEGILKVADFGLANFYNSMSKQPLTSRVVTLWYRPPELLLGATDYGAAVDLWSTGCVFAEVLLGKPILQGRTEVEQLHKIFKLCGSPPEEYWKKSKLPHVTLFKPQQPYKSSLWDACKGLPTNAVCLIETFLSVEPYKRQTASSALASEYFTTKPCACEPSTLPKYPPNKEIDAKYREEAMGKKTSGKVHGLGRKTAKKPTEIRRLALAPAENFPAEVRGVFKINGNNAPPFKERDVSLGKEGAKSAVEEASHVKNASQGDVPFTGPLQLSGSSDFSWAKRRVDGTYIRSNSRSSSRSFYNGFEASGASDGKSNFELKRHENEDALHLDSSGHDSCTKSKLVTPKQCEKLERPDSVDACHEYNARELSLMLYQKEEMATTRNNSVYHDHEEKVEFSGPLLSQSHKIDELLDRHERHIRQRVRKSWFQRGKTSGKQVKV